MKAWWLGLGLVASAAAGPLSEHFLIVAESGPLSKIFWVRRDGREWRRLTDRPGSEADAAYSSANDEVYYRRWLGQDWEIGAWHCRRGSERILDRSPGLDRQPQPSPDGRWLAFCSSRFGNEELLLLDLRDQASPRRLTWDQGHNVAPHWSPDGQHLVFASRRNGQSDLYRLEIASGLQQRLTETAEDEVDPRWSPDGKSILFQVCQGRYRQGCLETLDVQSLTRQPLSPLKGSAHQGSWSPDSRQIIYLDYRSARQPSSPALMLAQSDGSSAQPVRLYSPELQLGHWSFRQAAWVTQAWTP